MAIYKKDRVFILLIIGLLLLTSCSQINECENRFDFISTNDSIPILNLDYSEARELTLERMHRLYGTDDLCKKCGWVEFKSPFEIEGKKGYVKLIVDFDHQYCRNCPIAMRERNYFQILINANNQIFAEGELVTVGSLATAIKEYLSKVGRNDNFPETFNRFNYIIQWDRSLDSKFIDSIFVSVFSSHTDFVERQVLERNIDFCSINNEELTKLKAQYPLKIQIPGKSIDMPNLEEINEILEEIEEPQVIN